MSSHCPSLKYWSLLSVSLNAHLYLSFVSIYLSLYFHIFSLNSSFLFVSFSVFTFSFLLFLSLSTLFHFFSFSFYTFSFLLFLSLYFSSFLFHTFFYFRFSQCISLYFAHFFTWLIFSLPPSTYLPFFLTLSSTFYSVNVSLFYLFCVFVMGRCRSTVVVVVAARHRFFANL